MFEFSHFIEAYGATFGYIALASIIFAETGLFFGFFLPGDSVLFPAGLLASQGYLNIYVICIVTFFAATLGNVVGYFLGKYLGKRLFHREDSVLFHKDHILRARAFYNKYGAKTIIIGRFLPIIRTFAPVVAGISEMNFAEYFLYSTVGAALWAVGLPIAGFYLGRLIPDIDKYLIPVILLIILLSILPSILEMLKTKERRAKLLTHAAKIIKRNK